VHDLHFVESSEQRAVDESAHFSTAPAIEPAHVTSVATTGSY
jgi:hypothetical protein